MSSPFYSLVLKLIPNNPIWDFERNFKNLEDTLGGMTGDNVSGDFNARVRVGFPVNLVLNTPIMENTVRVGLNTGITPT